MELKLSEKEVQYLIGANSGTELNFEITGQDRFVIHHPKAKIAGEILGFTNRTVVIGYSLNFWKNLLINWFVKLEKEGISWDKKGKRMEINPFSFLPEKEQEATAAFRIQNFSIQPGILEINLTIR